MRECEVRRVGFNWVPDTLAIDWTGNSIVKDDPAMGFEGNTAVAEVDTCSWDRASDSF